MAAAGSLIDLRLGRWEEALADVEAVDCIVTDPPYSERTHAGHDAGVANMDTDGWRDHRGGEKFERRRHEYTAWTPEDVDRFVSFWTARCSGWFVAMTDHVLFPAWEAAFEAIGWYSFAPLPLFIPGSRFRSIGDGPPCCTVWLAVARPRRKGFFAWGALPGGYVGKREQSGKMVRVGGKPLASTRALVRDYSRQGQLVCNPCAGGGTTLLAAAIECRRAIGAEMDPETHAKALARIEAGYTPDMFAGVPEKPIDGEQGGLL